MAEGRVSRVNRGSVKRVSSPANRRASAAAQDNPPKTTAKILAKDQRYKAAYLFAAACPETNRSAALILPHANTEAMTLHLAEVSTQVTADAHAVVVLDQAGWHSAHDLDLPDNITLLHLPPYSPELNPIENLFQFLRHNFLNARVYDTYENIVEAC